MVLVDGKNIFKLEFDSERTWNRDGKSIENNHSKHRYYHFKYQLIMILITYILLKCSNLKLGGQIHSN